MGGQSKGSFSVADKAATFAGECKIVPFLKAPGFCKATTESGVLKKFHDVSSFLDGALYLTVRSTTPDYAGFKFAFAAKNVTSSKSKFGSFKTDFKVTAGADWQIVKVPFSGFSSDWSQYTGECNTKDPNGEQHVCCSNDHPEVCPTTSNLKEITDLEVWAEGTAGKFQLEIQSVAAGPL
jgi:hypothetical protein